VAYFSKLFVDFSPSASLSEKDFNFEGHALVLSGRLFLRQPFSSAPFAPSRLDGRQFQGVARFDLSVPGRFFLDLGSVLRPGVGWFRFAFSLVFDSSAMSLCAGPGGSSWVFAPTWILILLARWCSK